MSWFDYDDYLRISDEIDFNKVATKVEISLITINHQIDKYDEEQKEFIDSKYKDVTELADMFIVACGMTRFDAFTAIWYLKDVYDWVEECSILERDVEQAVAKKMAINRHRVWEKKGGLYKHIKD